MAIHNPLIMLLTIFYGMALHGIICERETQGSIN